MVGAKLWPQVPGGNYEYTEAAVLIIGAGISGMCTAIDLIMRNNCHNFVIVEKGSGPGGTWKDNTFPGCCCDVWSHLYSYSFAPKSDWTRLYPGQEEILDYLISVAQKYDLFKYIRFSSCVEQARWDDSEKKWKASIRVLNGKEAECHEQYTIAANFLVSATGQLNVPKYPEVPYLDHFKGRTMHSARWDWSCDVRGKKVAIIGSGCTAAQIAPEVAKIASDLTILQRTPAWIIPRGDAKISPLWRGLYKYVSPIRKRVRADMMDFRESIYVSVSDADSEGAKFLKQMSLDLMHKQLPHRPDLWAALTPNYPVGCKRTIVSDDYFPCVARENVHLETRKIQRFTTKGIEVEGQEHEFDLVIFATGFQTTSFFQNSIKITGSQGRTLESIWANGPKALYGITVESLPNFAMLYGPNTNLGHNSIVLMVEAQSRHINALVGAVLDARRKGTTLTICPNHDRLVNFNEEIQRVLKKTSYSHPACNSWYKNEDGTITQNWSGTVIAYQKLLSTLNWADYDLAGNGSDALRKQSWYIGRVVEETWVSYTTMAISVTGALALAFGLALKTPSKLLFSR